MTEIEAEDCWALHEQINELNLHLQTLVRILRRNSKVMIAPNCPDCGHSLNSWGMCIACPYVEGDE